MNLIRKLFKLQNGQFGSNQQKAIIAPVAERVKWSRKYCECLSPQYDNSAWRELRLHDEVQDTTCDAWRWLLELIEEAHSKQLTEFSPGLEMGFPSWGQILTLPASIGKLTRLRALCLYGSNLIRLPREIGQLSSLAELDLYTSYQLHWCPYEITRCPNLKSTRVSTRALYGNYKYRPPFPSLKTELSPRSGAACSICDAPCSESQVRRAWISLKVGKDVLPLLVNACSEDCMRNLPPPAPNYVARPHKGGLGLHQPQPHYLE